MEKMTMITTKEELFEAKKHLCRAYLDGDPDKLSENDLTIIEALVRDEEVQALLGEQRR